MKKSKRAFICDSWRKVQGRIYPYGIGELSNRSPAFALWDWKEILGIDCHKMLGN